MNLMEAYAKTISNDGVISQLFDYLNETEGMEVPDWLHDAVTARYIDNFYYFTWSGDKIASPLIHKLWDYEHDMLPVEMMEEIVKMFWSVNKDNLNRLWNESQKEYDPVDNYHVHEETGYAHSGGNWYTDRGNDTKVKTGQVKSYGTTKVTDKVYGFDSASAVNDSESETAVDPNTPMTTDYGTGTNGLTDTTTYGRGRDATDVANDTLETDKTGNLGIQPIADLLQKEFELWQWNFYKNVLFKALDSMLTIPIY